MLDPYVAASEAALPHLVDQLRGLAAGADQPFAKVMAANAFEELYGQIELGVGTLAALERCTDVVVPGPHGALSATPSSGTPATKAPSGSSSMCPTTGRPCSPRSWPARSRSWASTITVVAVGAMSL